jgi:hypothetical protein
MPLDINHGISQISFVGIGRNMAYVEQLILINRSPRKLDLSPMLSTDKTIPLFRVNHMNPSLR